MPHAKLMGGQAGVTCGQAAVSSWQKRVLQTGPAIVHWMPQVAAPGTVQAGVRHGTKGVWHPARVQKGAQVGLTDAQGWQVATCVRQGVKAVQATPQVLMVHAIEAI
jgi:hypothetical protein